MALTAKSLSDSGSESVWRDLPARRCAPVTRASCSRPTSERWRLACS